MPMGSNDTGDPSVGVPLDLLLTIRYVRDSLSLLSSGLQAADHDIELAFTRYIQAGSEIWSRQVGPSTSYNRILRVVKRALNLGPPISILSHIRYRGVGKSASAGHDL